eukprot:9352478-Pyramimonas_sp.AAC.1
MHDRRPFVFPDLCPFLFPPHSWLSGISGAMVRSAQSAFTSPSVAPLAAGRPAADRAHFRTLPTARWTRPREREAGSPSKPPARGEGGATCWRCGGAACV